MRKEVVWAIIAGVILGLVVAFGAYRINSKVLTSKTESPVNKDAFTPVPSVTPGIHDTKLTLDKPIMYDVTVENKIQVSGLTKPKTMVVINGSANDYIIESDSKGVFSQEVDLEPGVNQINATSFDTNANQSKENVLVVYSSSFQLTSTGSPVPADSTDAAAIRQKVAQDLANTKNKPKAYIGTVTDITDSTIEVKTATSDIQQISISSSATSVVNIVGTNNKQVKTSDIAIGDYIISMGYIEPNKVQTAQRILVSDPAIDSKITVSHAKVSEITRKTISVVSTLDNKDSVITPDTKTAFEIFKDNKVSSSKMTNISEGDYLIYVSIPDPKGNMTIRSIFTIPQN